MLHYTTAFVGCLTPVQLVADPRFRRELVVENAYRVEKR